MQQPARHPATIAALAAAGSLATLLACATGGDDAPDASSATLVRSSAEFTTVARVLRHPRCLNCHTVTDFPRTGDERRPHAMNVRRGREHNGLPGMRCKACHRDENQELAGVPGAPSWHLAPLSMGWEGLDDHELAEALKDRARNGGKSLEEIFHHMAEDPLVLWGWDPGRGRAAPPTSHAELVEALRAWIDMGAPTPPAGTTSTF